VECVLSEISIALHVHAMKLSCKQHSQLPACCRIIIFFINIIKARERESHAV
jgi:hypothetical protein